MNTTQRRISFLVVAALVVAVSLSLVNCGGGGGGGGGGGNGGYPHFAYVANSGDNTISVYAVDAVTGQLTNKGYVPAGIGTDLRNR